MTTGDFCIKWAAYLLGLFPAWIAQAYLFSAWRPFGVRPLLLPLCVMAVATLEGPSAGAGFGLLTGLLMDAVVPGWFPGSTVFLLSVLGFAVGTLTRFGLRQSLTGCLLCSALALVLLDALHLLPRFLFGVSLFAMLRLAGKEILWSLCWVPVIYPLFRWIYNRVPKAAVL